MDGWNVVSTGTCKQFLKSSAQGGVAVQEAGERLGPDVEGPHSPSEGVWT